MKTCFRAFSILLAFGCLLFSLAPMLLYHVSHTGTAVMLVFGVLLLWTALNSEKKRGKGVVWLHQALSLGLSVFLAAGCALSVMMVKAAYFLPANPEGTVLILGSQVINGKPSTMLQNRLDAAVDFVKSHPDVPIICTGGGADSFSEGQVMAQYLIDHEIEMDRIYIEEKASDTAENLLFSSEIIQKHALPQTVNIVTDGFHQLRAQIYAKKVGLTANAVPAKSPWGLVACYWVREWFAIAEAIFL